MPGGRPLKFKSVKDLQAKIDAYFDACDPHMEEVTTWVQQRSRDGSLVYDDDGQPILIEKTFKRMTYQVHYTITGLCMALDTNRETLRDYGTKAKYSDTIKKAKLRVENYTELMLYRKDMATGAIFNLKNNYGWKDRNELDVTSQNKPLPLLSGLAPSKLTVEDDDAAPGEDDSAGED